MYVAIHGNLVISFSTSQTFAHFRPSNQLCKKKKSCKLCTYIIFILSKKRQICNFGFRLKSWQLSNLAPLKLVTLTTEMGASSECRSGVRPCVLAFVAFFEVLLVRGPHSIPPSPLLIAAAGSNKIVEGDTETVRRLSLGNFEMDSSWRTSGWFLGSILNFWWLNGLVCYCNLQLIVKKSQ